jgi:hypothetical protein
VCRGNNKKAGPEDQSAFGARAGHDTDTHSLDWVSVLWFARALMLKDLLSCSCAVAPHAGLAFTFFS